MDKNTDIVQLKFSFTIPTNRWLGQISVKYPLLQFNVLSTLLLKKNQVNSLIQIKGVKLDNFWNDLSNTYDEEKYALVFRDTNTILINIIFDGPWILQNIMDAQLIIRFPLIISNGMISIELIAKRNKIELMFKNPKWKGINVSVKQIGQYCPDSLLTPKQTDILIHALKNGFYDIPRKKTLSSMASALNLSPSALSENIRRINKKLSENYLDCISTQK
jgi:predicted DNA binding protein